MRIFQNVPIPIIFQNLNMFKYISILKSSTLLRLQLALNFYFLQSFLIFNLFNNLLFMLPSYSQKVYDTIYIYNKC